MEEKTKILFMKTVQNTKIIFHKSTLNFKLFLFRNLQKIPNAIITKLFPFSPRQNLNEAQEGKNRGVVPSPKQQKSGDPESIASPRKVTRQISGGITKEKRIKERIKRVEFEEVKKREHHSMRLAKKMKELEMMDVEDIEHVMDVEEVLHQYSSITSPVYVEIVDKFFMDMYREYLLPLPTLSASGSMRSNGSMPRLGPLKL